MFSGAYKFYIGYELIRYVKFIMYNYAFVKRTSLMTGIKSIIILSSILGVRALVLSMKNITTKI